ncbi:MAG TPA: diguanylate cyclase [Planctomycetota bacterium]|nr:diguanylate cyclase [Planctomycetota bacterium]
MDFNITKESIVFLGGIVCSSILIPLLLPFFRKLGIVDRPNARSTHTRAIPRGVGIIVALNFLGILFTYRIFAPNAPLEENGQLLALLWSTALLVFVGFLDDIHGVSASVKLLFQAGSAILLIISGLVIPLPSLFGEYQTLVEQTCTLLWIVGVVNAVNFIDGSDGLATTLSCLCMLLFVGIGRILPADYAKNSTELVRSVNLLGLAGAGCALPFLLYNLAPARCFLGDAGSTFFGLILAVLGILTAQYNAPLVAQGDFSYNLFAVPWLILIVPIADGLRVAFGRISRGSSPLRPDNRHLHHLLHRAGLSANQMLFIVSLSVGIFGLGAAILVRSNQSPFLLMGIAVLLVYGFLWFLKSSYRARRFVTLALNRRLLHFMDVTEGYENPASFKERFEQELARAKRHGSGLTVVVVNAALRRANAAGASPLENPRVLEDILRALRREDVKCRFSNDRLAILLVETDKEFGASVCHRIWDRFESMRQGESSDLNVKVGMAAYPKDGVSVTALLQCAEVDAASGRVYAPPVAVNVAPRIPELAPSASASAEALALPIAAPPTPMMAPAVPMMGPPVPMMAPAVPMMAAAAPMMAAPLPVAAAASDAESPLAAPIASELQPPRNGAGIGPLDAPADTALKPRWETLGGVGQLQGRPSDTPGNGKAWIAK